MNWEGWRPALYTAVCRQALLLLLFMEQVHLWQRKMHAKRVSFSGVFLFMCMHIMDPWCMCIHSSVGWLSLGFGSVGASEIQTDVNNIAAGIWDFILWYPRDRAYSLQFSESSWAFKFSAPPSLKSSQHCYDFQLFILAGGCSPDTQCADTWYLSSVSLCAMEDETLQLLVSRLHALRF